MSDSPTVELVFFAGCPMVDAVRASLRAALAHAGLPSVWREWDQLDPGAPERILGFGSPTVLVGDKDVMGEGGRSPGLSCRADGGPTPEAILAALRRSAGPHP